MRRLAVYICLAITSCFVNRAAGVLRIIGPSAVVEKDGYVSFAVIADPPPRYSIHVDVRVTGTGASSNNFRSLTPFIFVQPDTLPDSVVLELFQDSQIEPDEELTIELSPHGDTDGYSFPEPFHVRFLDDESIGMPAVELSGPSWLNESAESYAFEARLNRPSNETLRVHWRLTGETAVAGEDFVAAAGTLEFPPNETKARFSVALLNDSAFEQLESFKIELFDPSAGLFVATPATQIFIVDDDRGYRFHYSTLSYTTEDSTNSTLWVDRVGSFQFRTTVQMRIEPITAIPGVDYPDETYTVEFGPGESLASFPLHLLNDELEDGTKQLRLVLTNPSDGLHLISGEETTMLQIFDNEGGYSLLENYDPLAHPQGDFFEGPNAYVMLFRNGDYESPSDVNVTFHEAALDPFSNPPATPGIDFVPSTVTVHFGQGEKSARVPLPIIDDALPERTELIGLSFPQRIRGGEPIVETSVQIIDNEFNPLPVHPLRPLGLTAWSFAPVGQDKALAVLLESYQLNSTSTIVQLTANGEMDPTFEPVKYSGYQQFLSGPNGTIFLLDSPNASYLTRFRRLKPDGAVDPTFAPYESRAEFGVCAGAHGELFIGETGTPNYLVRIVKLGPDGLPDLSFAPPQIQQEQGPIRFLAALPDGTVYAASPFSFYVQGKRTFLAKFAANGAVDSSVGSQVHFNDLRLLDGRLYSLADKGWVRLLANGQIDPTCSPLGSLLKDSQGRFYTPGYGRDFPTQQVTRFNSDGVPDTSYFPGTIFYWYRYGYTFGPDSALIVGQSLFVQGHFTHVNGAFLTSDEINSARIDLEPPLPRFQLDPQSPPLTEKGGPTTFTVLRAGSNFDTAARVHYRLRSGSAVEGNDFKTQEGDLLFEAGVSRLKINLSAIDDSEAEENESLSIDFFLEDGTPAGTSDITLQSDDIGLRIFFNSQTQRLEIAGVGLGSGSAMLETSTDLQTWSWAGNLEQQTGLPVYNVDTIARFYRISR